MKNYPNIGDKIKANVYADNNGGYWTDAVVKGFAKASNTGTFVMVEDLDDGELHAIPALYSLKEIAQ